MSENVKLVLTLIIGYLLGSISTGCLLYTSPSPRDCS